MKMSDILTKTDKEIVIEIYNLKREMLNLKFQKAAGELSNPSRCRVVRKLIAKFKTVASQRKNKAK